MANLNSSVTEERTSKTNVLQQENMEYLSSYEGRECIKKSSLSKSLPQGSDDPIDEHVLCI